MVPPQKNKAEALEENAAGALHTRPIDLDYFQRQLKKFYSHWREYKMDFWGGCDVIAVMVSASFATESSAFSFWLLGHQVPQLIMIFLERQIHFLCAKEKASLPETLKIAVRNAVGVDLYIHMEAKTDNWIGLMDEILQMAEDGFRSDASDFQVGGLLQEENAEGKLLEIWAEKSKKKFQLCNVAEGFTELFLVKESFQLVKVKKAASFVSFVMGNFIAPKFHEIAQGHCFRIFYSDWIDSVEEFILEQAEELKLGPENIEICYRPMFQSSCGINLDDLSLETYNWDLGIFSTGVIISKIGLRYKGYCSNIARTFLLSPHPVQCKALKVLLEGQKAAIGALKPGNKASAAYEAAFAVIQKESPEFAMHMTSSTGTGIGLKLCEAGLSLDSHNDRMLKTGMVLDVSIGFEGVHAETNNPMTEKFSLLLADTVVINEDGAEVLTVVGMEEEIGYIHRNGCTSLPVVASRSEDKDALDNASVVTRDSVGNVADSRKLSIEVKKDINAVLVPIHDSVLPFHISSIKSAHVTGLCQPEVLIEFEWPTGTILKSLNTSSRQVGLSGYVESIRIPAGDVSISMKAVQEINALRQHFCLREAKRAKLGGELAR